MVFKIIFVRCMLFYLSWIEINGCSETCKLPQNTIEHNSAENDNDISEINIKMTWLPAESMNKLLDNLKIAGILKTPRILETMQAFDRALFCSSPKPYSDSPQSIGYGATISAPHMHAYALEFMKDKLVDGARALDVGSGSGILSAYMAYMVSPTGMVVGVDHIEELVNMSIENVKKAKPELLKDGILKLVVADGRSAMFEEGPFDVIHVGAACREEPKHLLDQLKPSGVMVAPVGTYSQSFIQYKKDANGKVEKKTLLGVVYVPLTDKEDQLGRYR
ncbi:hypothetical protein GJ496_003327 [Pomphorhynchus laevis]|nr:hypothetical protein GJ496_003327 [Pomphorhynchus laevis]